MAIKAVYRIKFVQNEKICEIYARYIAEDTLVGFIELGDLEGLNKNHLEKELINVSRCYVPMHTILRIDEIENSCGLTLTSKDSVDKVHAFPNNQPKDPQE